ncbi:hypothetical protein Tco_0790696 [Tanacetum coccineum]
MAANQAIECAHQCGELTVKSLTFRNNNVVGVFRYPKTAPAYHEICKYLMNYPLAEDFTKIPLVAYQNLPREFWCTAIATYPNLPTDDSEVLPLKEYKIKFSMMNDIKPLALNYKTFIESTRLDYAKGTYVSHPSPKAVKAELAKIVLDGNYSSIEQVNSIKHLFACCLLIGTKVDIGEIIYSDLVTRLINKSRQRYVSCPRFISCALAVLLGPDYTQDESFGSSPTILSNSNFSKDPSIVTLIELTTFIVAVNKREHAGPEAPRPLPQKRKKPKSKKTPSETRSADKGLPSTASNKGTAKTMPCPEGPLRDKDLEGNKPPDDMEPINPTVIDPLGTGVEYQVDETQSTRLRFQTLTKNKGKTSSGSDKEEVFAVGDDMEEDTQADEEEHKSPSLNKDKPEPSHSPETQVSNSDSSRPDLKRFNNTLPLTERQLVKYLRKVFKVLFHRINEEQCVQHEEAVVSYANLRATIEGYYEENVDHRKQTDKLVQATMDSFDKTATDRVNLLNALNGVTDTLKAVQDAVKDDPTLNKKVIEATKANIKNSFALTGLLSLIKKAAEEAKMFEMTKTEVIKVVQEEAEKIRLDPKTIISAKAGEKFKKAQDAEHQFLKIEHSQKAKREMKLKKKRANDRRNFQVHNPFKFADFGVTELDELGPIIQKKKKTIVKDLMTSLGKRYERLKKIPEELRIQSALPALVLEQAPSESLGRKRKHMVLEPEIKVPGLECNRSLPKGVPFENNMVIEEPEYVIFFTDVLGDQAFQRWNDIHKVRVDSLVSYLIIASMIKTQENASFSLKLRKLIAKHPDQEKLKSKRVKLEALGYKLD